MAAKNGSEFLTYKGRPLVRCGDTIYYGSMTEKFVIKLEIKPRKRCSIWRWPTASPLS